MSTIILYLTLIISSVEPQTNPYIGEWEIDWVEDLDNFCKVKEEDYQDFKSSIEFKSDFTFIKKTNGKVTNGYYSYTPNKFKFYELNGKGKKKVIMYVRIPKKSDLSLVRFHELIPRSGKAGQDKSIWACVYYKKRTITHR